MARQAYLNELSFRSEEHVSPESGSALFEQLFRLLREVDRRANGVTVIGHRRLIELSIGDCSVGAWLRNDVDRKRRLKALDDRAPFDAETDRLAGELEGVLEYQCSEQQAIGLGLASWQDELAVSVDVEPWQTELVELRREQLFEDDEGNLVESASNVRARNASQIHHLDAHEDWLRSPTRDFPRTPDELWLNRGQWYPNIAFLRRVEPQIRGLAAGSPAMRQVTEKLSALQDVLVDWNGNGQPDWGVKVVGEYEGRERYCWFEDLDGEKRLFELHVRYAPGPNRIHFRLDAPHLRIVVAHVGRKLGI